MQLFVSIDAWRRFLPLLSMKYFFMYHIKNLLLSQKSAVLFMISHKDFKTVVSCSSFIPQLAPKQWKRHARPNWPFFMHLNIGCSSHTFNPCSFADQVEDSRSFMISLHAILLLDRVWITGNDCLSFVTKVVFEFSWILYSMLILMIFSAMSGQSFQIARAKIWSSSAKSFVASLINIFSSWSRPLSKRDFRSLCFLLDRDSELFKKSLIILIWSIGWLQNRTFDQWYMV